MLRATLATLLGLAMTAHADDKKPEPGKAIPETTPLELTIKGDTTKYVLDLGGKTPAEFEKLLGEVKDGKGRAPKPPEVKLTLVNTGTSPIMKHNFVLVKAGSEADVAAKGIEAGEPKAYVPALDSVLASSPLANPGQTVTVTFKAPPFRARVPATVTRSFKLPPGVLAWPSSMFSFEPASNVR